MSSNKESVKKKLEEDRIKAQELANLELDNQRKQQGAVAEEEERKQAANNQRAINAQLNPFTFQTSPKPTPKANQDWQKIVADYVKKFPKVEAKENSLSFTSREEAIDFFQDQAAKKRTFMLYEMDEHGKKTGFCVLSTGNGQLYKGTAAEIQAKLNQGPQDEYSALGNEMLKSMLNPTPNYREAVKNNRNEPEEEESPQARVALK